MPDGRARLRVLAWNIWIGNDPANVRRSLVALAALFRPHVIALQEARRFNGSIPGYRRYAADGTHRPDADQNIVLVRRGLNVVKHGAVNVHGDGWTYEGNPKPPRTFYGLVVKKSGLSWHVLNVHRCVGGPRGNSPDEWAAEDNQIERWEAKVPHGHPTCIVGDWNDPGTSRAPGTVADLADRLNVDILTPGGIDYALTRGCRGVIRRLARFFGSDHAPLFVTLRAPRPR